MEYAKTCYWSNEFYKHVKTGFFIVLGWAVIFTVLSVDRFLNSENERLEETHRVFDNSLGSMVAPVENTAGSIEKIAGSVAGVEKTLSTVPDKLDNQMTRLNDTLKGTSDGVIDQLSEFNDSVAPLADSSSLFVRKLDTMTGLFTDQFLKCDGNPGCAYSRWLAMSGEAMRTMDSGRRMMAQAEKAAPMFIEQFGVLTQQSAGIATDLHTITNRYANPTWKQTVRGAVTDGAKICAFLCF